MQDQTLTCRDCGREFIWTVGEQEFYQQKGFDNKPSRCPEDRKKRKMGNGGTRESFPITCSICGKADTVPFKPTPGREVFCREHFAEQRAQQQ